MRRSVGTASSVTVDRTQLLRRLLVKVAHSLHRRSVPTREILGDHHLLELFSRSSKQTSKVPKVISDIHFSTTILIRITIIAIRVHIYT